MADDGNQPPMLPAECFKAMPDRNPEKYGKKVNKTGRDCAKEALNFFMGTVKRGRNRRQRLNDLEDTLQKGPLNYQQQGWISAARHETGFLRFMRNKDMDESFQIVQVIRQSAFKDINLVRNKLNGRLFVLKSQRMVGPQRDDSLSMVRCPRKQLFEAESPWVAKMFSIFEDSISYFGLYEFLPGGSLMTLLMKHGTLTEDTTRFYIAECIAGIESIHKLGFIHGDIKPSNILLDGEGHVKMSDFGLNCGLRRPHDETFYQKLGFNLPEEKSLDLSAVGPFTMQSSYQSRINAWHQLRERDGFSDKGILSYIALEKFGFSGYSYDCDFWSLGVIMFECLVGYPPFFAEQQDDTYKQITNWKQAFFVPANIQLSREAEDLVRSLICNSEDRLGRGGVRQLTAHPFFSGIGFGVLRRMKAPFEPNSPSGVTSTQYPVENINKTQEPTIQFEGRQETAPGIFYPFRECTFEKYKRMFD